MIANGNFAPLFENRARRRLGLIVGWAMVAAIVALTLLPPPPGLELGEKDKLAHLLAYGVLMFWFGQVYPRRQTRSLYAVGLVAMGVGLEHIQGLLGYRTYDVLDMYANSLGVVLGWFMATLSQRAIIR
jgi:VanZ family protein